MGEPKRDIIDQEVEEAFAKVGANPNDVAPAKNETQDDDDGGVNLNDDHDSNFQFQEPHIGEENGIAVEEAEDGDIEEKEIDDTKDIDAVPQIDNPPLQRGNKPLSEEVIEREDKEEAAIDAAEMEEDDEDRPEHKDEDLDDKPREESELKGLDPDDETFDDDEFDALIDEEE